MGSQRDLLCHIGVGPGAQLFHQSLDLFWNALYSRCRSLWISFVSRIRFTGRLIRAKGSPPFDHAVEIFAWMFYGTATLLFEDALLFRVQEHGADKAFFLLLQVMCIGSGISRTFLYQLGKLSSHCF